MIVVSVFEYFLGYTVGVELSKLFNNELYPYHVSQQVREKR